ncbi:MAG TPA: hypothetical protein VK039_12380, partial [Brevibacterium sp.]|nr:hypothetical protein [Brevibacterium sp.]
MRWPSAIEALLGIAGADAELVAALGGPRIYRRREIRQVEVPSVAYTIVTAGLEEVMEPVLTQWDIFAGSMNELVTIERRLRRLY